MRGFLALLDRLPLGVPTREPLWPFNEDAATDGDLKSMALEVSEDGYLDNDDRKTVGVSNQSSLLNQYMSNAPVSEPGMYFGSIYVDYDGLEQASLSIVPLVVVPKPSFELLKATGGGGTGRATFGVPTGSSQTFMPGTVSFVVSPEPSGIVIAAACLGLLCRLRATNKKCRE